MPEPGTSWQCAKLRQGSGGSPQQLLERRGLGGGEGECCFSLMSW